MRTNRLLFLLPFLLLLGSVSAVTPPPGVAYYTQLTWNGQFGLSNAQLPANAYVMIPMNVMNYSRFFNSNMSNGEFFWQNGTVIPSWLETQNSLNFLQKTTSPYSINALYFVNYGWNPATLSGASGTTNTMIYFGWSGNVVSGQNDLMDCTTTGESPLISTSYAKCDSGYTVFGTSNGFYDNFNGVTLGSEWTKFGAANVVYTVNNGLDMRQTNGGSSPGVFASWFPISRNAIMESYFRVYNAPQYYHIGMAFSTVAADTMPFNGYSSEAGGTGNTLLRLGKFVSQAETNPFTTANTLFPGANYINTLKLTVNSLALTISQTGGETKTTASGSESTYGLLNFNQIIIGQRNNNADFTTNWIRAGIPQPSIQILFGSVTNALTDIQWTASNSVLDQNNWQTLTSNVQYSINPYTNNFLVYNNAGSLVANFLNTNSFTQNTFTFQMSPAWGTGTFTANIIVTDASGATVTNTLTFTVSTALTASISSPSNVIADVGQWETFTSTASGGLGTYTFNTMVSNFFSQGIITHNVLDPSDTASTNILAFQLTTVDLGNSIQEGNVIINDALTTVNSIYSANFVVNPALIAGAITPSSPTINSGQSVTLTSHASAGSPSYSYKWYTHTGSGDPICDPANIIAGTSSTFSASPSATNTYDYQVTDSASTPVSVCSSADTVTVNGAFVEVTWIASTDPINTGATQTLTGTVTGGTPGYTWNFLVYNSVGLVANFLTNNAFTANAFSYTQLAAWGTGTFTANLFVTDGAGSPQTVSNTLTYNVPTPAPPAASCTAVATPDNSNIPLVLIFLAICVFVTLGLAGNDVLPNQYVNYAPLFRDFGMLAAFVFVLVASIEMLPLPATGNAAFSMAITSNTLYSNNAMKPLIVIGMFTTQDAAWIGNFGSNNGNLIPAANSFDAASLITDSVIVPPGWCYLWNYTVGTFTGEYAFNNS